jgi:hypothetical protein
MRLRRIKQTLEKNVVHLNYKREYLSGNQPGFLYTDITNLIMAMDRVKNQGLYVSLISEIETSIIFSTAQDDSTIYVQMPKVKDLKDAQKKLSGLNIPLN